MRARTGSQNRTRGDGRAIENAFAHRFKARIPFGMGLALISEGKPLNIFHHLWIVLTPSPSPYLAVARSPENVKKLSDRFTPGALDIIYHSVKMG